MLMYCFTQDQRFFSNSVHKVLLPIKWNKKEYHRSERHGTSVRTGHFWVLASILVWLTEWPNEEVTDGKNKWVRKMSGEKTNTAKK